MTRPVNVGAKGKFECSAPVGLIVKKSKCGKNFIGTNQITFDEVMDQQAQACN